MLADLAARPALRDPEPFVERPPWPAGARPGSIVSPAHLFQHVDVERLVGHDLL
jgi:hypothetical protein